MNHFKKWKEGLIHDIFQKCYSDVLDGKNTDIKDYTISVINEYERVRLNKTIGYISTYFNSDGCCGKWRADLPDGEYFNRHDVVSALDGFINQFGDIDFTRKITKLQKENQELKERITKLENTIEAVHRSREK